MSPKTPPNPNRWKHQQFGSLQQPVHKSDIGNALGTYGCMKSFQLGKRSTPKEDTVPAMRLFGSAFHAPLARMLADPKWGPKVCAGERTFTPDELIKSLDEEIDKEADGKEITYPKGKERQSLLEERAVMCAFILNNLHKYAKRIIAVEAPFIAPIGRYYLGGTIDAIYETNEGGIAVVDWKTGKQVPAQIQLDEGPEMAFYGHALKAGYFGAWPSESRTGAELDLIAELEPVIEAAGGEFPAPTYGVFPDELGWVHMQNALPYKRKGGKEIKRIDDLKHYGMLEPAKRAYEAGESRGSLMYRSQRVESGVRRLESTVNNFIRCVRMGAFPERITGDCDRCGSKNECMNSGYDARGEELSQIRAAVKSISNEELFAADGGL